MSVGYVTHDETMIEIFMEEPEYANELLNDVLVDGDDYEIQRVQSWINEAKARSQNAVLEMNYWDTLNEHAKVAVKNGLNLRQILTRLNEAVSTVKSAMARKLL